MNIQQNSKSFLGMSNETRRMCLMEENRNRISLDTVPLIGTYDLQGGPILRGVVIKYAKVEPMVV
jgi:hypothetical protein